MTKDESQQLAKIKQELDDFIEMAKPIFEALNGPKGWFTQIETRMTTQESRSKMVFTIFGALWAVAMIVIGVWINNFATSINTINKLLLTKP